MHGEGFFFQAFVYLSAAVLSVPLAKRLGLGSVLGYLIAGMVIGPFGLRLVGEEGQDVMHFAEFGVVMMLFLVGLELEPTRLWRLRGPILGLGGLQVAVTTGALAGIGALLGLGWREALAVGMILSLSSTAIVLQSFNEKGLLQTPGGQSGFAVLLFQDIAVIPMLALLPLLGSGGGEPDTAHGTTWVADLPAAGQTLAVLLAVVAIVFGGRFLVQPAFRIIARTRLREIFTAAALLLVIGIALLMTRVGLSPALGTFLAGVVLANSEYRHELESDVEPFKGLLIGLFFIAVGASIDFALLRDEPATIAGLVGGLLLTKLIVLLLLGRLFGFGLDHCLLLAFSLAQAGEFAFVLFSFAVQAHVLDEQITGLLIVTVALGMAATPLLMIFNERLLLPRVGTRTAPAREADALDEESAVIVAGYGRFGQIVDRFLRANGVNTTVLDFDADQVDLLRSLGHQVYYGDASRYDLLRSAGAAEAKLLVLALDNEEKHREMIATARKHFPQLVLLARARGRTEAYGLLDAGAEGVYRETFDSALRMGVDALERLGLRAYRAHRAALTFRRHDEAVLRELARVRHDQTAYVTLAKQATQDLAYVLSCEPPEVDMTDAAWDTESLRREYGSGDEEAE